MLPYNILSCSQASKVYAESNVLNKCVRSES